MTLPTRQPRGPTSDSSAAVSPRVGQRLLLVTHYYAAHRGGVELVAEALARRLCTDHGWHVVWMASDSDASPLDPPAELTAVPARACNWTEKRLGFPWPIWSPVALRSLWQAVGAADVVHLHDALYFGNAFAWGFARLRRVPVMVTQHVGNVPYRSFALRTLHRVANRTLGRMILSTAQHVVFISPAVRDEFAGFCRFAEPPGYLPNGVDPAIYGPEGSLWADPSIVAARAAHRLIVLFVGRFVEKKGLPLLRCLAQRCDEILWVFAGSGPLDPATWGFPNVHVVRGISGGELASLYRAADLLVLPSVGEGFPLVVQEAMACGTPVLVSEEVAAGCPEARQVMLVEPVGPPHSSERWTARIALLGRDRKALRARGRDGATFASAHWSWRTTAAAYATEFSRLGRQQ